MGEAIRSFVAIELPGEVKKELLELAARLDGSTSGIRWVKPGALHLTLSFLGGLSPEVFEALGRQIQKGVRCGGPMDLRAASVGAFPNPRRPRAVWVGLSGETGRLEKLSESVNLFAADLGIPLETRPFKPHLTIGRAMKDRTPSGVEKAVGEFLGWSGTPWTAGEIILFESVLEPGGARHIARARGLII